MEAGSLHQTIVVLSAESLAPLRFEPIPSCEQIISIVRKKLEESCELIDNPTSFSLPMDLRINTSDYEPASYESTDKPPESVGRIDEKKLLESYKDLQVSEILEVREMAFTEITDYSEKEDFWNFNVSWKIIEFLISSDGDYYRMRGINILTEMLKKSRRVLGENNHVMKNANELYSHKLLESIKPDSSKRITSDSLDVLEIILDYDNLFNICLGGLIDGIKSIRDDREYGDYIQKFVLRLERGNREQIHVLCEKMRIIAKTNQETLVKKRALSLFNFFHKKTL